MKYQLLILAAFLIIFGCSKSGPIPGSPEHISFVVSAITDSTILSADNSNGDWVSHGGSYQEERYSKLDQITKNNVKDLGLAWTLNLGTKRGIQSTPLVVDGIIFATGPWSVAYAINARNGELLWTYDPEVPREVSTNFCCGVVNRGMAILEGDLFFGTLDGRLISLKASDGSVNWAIDTKDGSGRTYSITGAPRVVKGNVVIGNGGAEFDARGYVTAYNAKTGDQAWRFYTVPGDPSKPFENTGLEEAAKTWTGEWWKQGGGGTVWDAIVYDPELDQLYIGVGNGAHWNRQIRSPEGGDNLYLSSIVALNPDDGSYKWHYQTTPGDTWDYTATQHLVQTDMTIDGKEHKVLMQAPKNGFFYIIDREDGSLLSADSYTYQTWTTGMGPDGRPIEAENARYLDGRSYWMSPGNLGGHNWQPMSYSKSTGLVYIPTLGQSTAYANNPDVSEGVAAKLKAQVSVNAKLYFPPVIDPNGHIPGTSFGELIAYDPVKQEKVWSVRQKYHYNSGVLSTSTNLVFQGDAEGKFTAYDAANGEQLWQFDVRTGAIGSPVTYLVDGVQHVTIMVGWGGVAGQSGNAAGTLHPGTVYTFKIGGNVEAPEKIPFDEKPYTQLKTDAKPNHIGEGFNVFVQYCIGCHGDPGLGGGAIPDLTRSSDQVYANMSDIVLDGSLLSQGMPGFSQMLSEEELDDIKSFLMFTADAFDNGMDPMTWMTKMAGMQYMADINPPKRKNIE